MKKFEDKKVILNKGDEFDDVFSEKNTNYIVDFSKLSLEDFEITIKNIFGLERGILFGRKTGVMSEEQKEIKNFKRKKLDRIFTPLIKHLPFEYKVACFKIAFLDEHLINSHFIINIYNLIKGHNMYDDSFFESEDVFVNSMAQFSDLKSAIKPEMQTFINNMSKWYLATIKSCSVSEFTPRNMPELMPMAYQSILDISDFIEMSQIVRKAEAINIKELPNVHNATANIVKLSERMVGSNVLMEEIFGKYTPKKTKKKVKEDDNSGK